MSIALQASTKTAGLMIWVSRGRGGWALGIPFLFSLLLVAGDRLGFFPRDPGAGKWILIGLALASGLVTTGLGFYLNREPKSFRTIDPSTGQEYIDKSARHSMYYIPLQYWGLFYCALALLAGVAFH